jgi:hypothetical protein
MARCNAPWKWSDIYGDTLCIKSPSIALLPERVNELIGAFVVNSLIDPWTCVRVEYHGYFFIITPPVLKYLSLLFFYQL